MPFNVNHIHLKSSDPKKTADWFVEAFNVEIVSDNVRPVGDRFIVTKSEGGLAINISSERTDEKLGPADANPHYGLEHFGFDTDDMDADIARLVSSVPQFGTVPITTPVAGFLTSIVPPLSALTHWPPIKLDSQIKPLKLLML